MLDSHLVGIVAPATVKLSWLPPAEAIHTSFTFKAVEKMHKIIPKCHHIPLMQLNK